MRKLFTLLIAVAFTGSIQAQTSELIISEYIEGWSNNKALELYNPTPYDVALSDFRLIRYSNGEDVPPPQDTWTVSLPDYTLKPYETFVIVIDQRNPAGTGQDAPVWSQLGQRADAFLCPEYEVSEVMYFNGDDAIVIEKDEGGGEYIINDIFGRWGPPAPAEAKFVDSEKMDNAWTDVAPYVTGEGVAITAEHTMIRKSNVSTGITSNPALFNPLAEYDTLSANTFYMLGWHEFDNAPANETPVITNESLIFAVSPSATNGTQIATIEAADAEDDNLKFYIDYGNFIYINDVRIEPFELNKTTGVLSLIDETGLAPEVLDTFYLTLNITDGHSQLGPVTAMVIVTDEPVSINSLESTNLKVYPNPVSGSNFSISDSKAFSSVSILKLTGQVIHRMDLSNPLFQKIISLENQKQGIYMIQVGYPDGTKITQKIIVQ